MKQQDEREETLPNCSPEPVWVMPPSDDEAIQAICKEFGLHRTLAQILVSRGLTDLDQVNKYLYAKLPDLIDPLSMPGMKNAVDRVIDAMEKDEPILIYGDNDVDGMTATALLADFLTFVGAKAHYYITQPGASRHSLIIEALDFALEKGCKLLITVDCGITAATEIQQLIDHDIDVIITDHHEPTDIVPKCIATLNPKLVGSTYENRDITGVGVAFKLAHGITNRLVSQKKISSRKIDLKRYLDLVAMGTISDMAPLIGENRIFIRYGLKQLKKTRRVGLAKLISVCGLETNNITTSTVASKIAPRMNSLGRIADPTKGVKLLLFRDAVAAENLAKELDLNNTERQRIERVMSLEVEERLTEKPDILSEKAIVLSSENWHPGIIAILSTRISKQYNRPTIMFAVEDGMCKGSIRSIPEFPVLQILKDNAHMVANFGGHDYAAGVTVPIKNIQKFTKNFIQAANKALLESDVVNKIKIDAEVRFSDLTFDFMDMMSLLEPHGTGNALPVLYAKAQQVWQPKIVGKTHLKMYLEQGDRMLEGIGFHMAEFAPLLRHRDMHLEIAFTPQINDFQNKSSIQLVIRSFKIISEH